MKSSLSSRPRIRRLIAFTAGGALLAGSVSASAFAAPSDIDELSLFKRGTLVIEKQLENPGGAILDDVEFELNWQCKGGGSEEDDEFASAAKKLGFDWWGDKSGTVFLAAGESISIENIPGKKTCTVTEVEPASLEYFTWDKPIYDPESVVVFKDTQKITVKNKITRDLGELKIMKELAQGSTAFEGEFAIDYSCEATDESPGAPVTGSVNVPAGDSEVVSIPTGYTCVVTETTFPSVPGFVWTTPLIAGSPTAAIVGGEGEAREVTVVNQLTAAPTPPPPPPPAPAPEPAAAPAAATPPPAGAAPEATPVVPETPVTPAPGTGVTPTTPVTSVDPAPGTGVPTSVNAGEGPAPSNGISVTMWLLMIAAISAAVTWGLTRWTAAEGDTHMQKVHME
jgi:hypothetical protein